MTTYYEDDKILIRESNEDDALYIGLHMREADKKEVWASHNLRPLEAMKQSLDDSFMCITVLFEYTPVLMFGVVPRSVLGDIATVWMLSTDEIEKIKRFFIRNSKSFIRLFLRYYPKLENYVHDRNTKSIEWLKYCGANIGEPIELGAKNRVFRYFSFERDKLCADQHFQR